MHCCGKIFSLDPKPLSASRTKLPHLCGFCIQSVSMKESNYGFVLYSLMALHSPLMLSKAYRVLYGVTSNSGPFTRLDNFSTRIFPFLLNTSTKFSSTLKWKAGVSSLRWVAQCCPAEQQYKLFVLKPQT